MMMMTPKVMIMNDDDDDNDDEDNGDGNESTVSSLHRRELGPEDHGLSYGRRLLLPFR